MSSPRRVVWISCVGEKGGSEVTMLNTFRVLDRSRFRPGVVLLRPGPLEAELREIGVDTWVLRQHRMRNVPAVVGAIWRIRQIIKREAIDLIHSNGFRAHAYGGPSAWLAGVPEVWTNHTVEKNTFSTTLICAVPTRQIIANCTRTENYFRNRGLPAQTVWPGVNVQRLEQGTPREALARKFNLPANKRWVGMGARLQRFKGHIHFLRALAALPSDTDAHGIIIGGALFGLEQDYVAELKRNAAELGIGERVTFTGFVPDADVAGLLAASALVVHPALDEDFGLTVAESQALGVPVLSFATVGPSAIIEGGKTGWLVPIGDQNALTQGLAQALSSAEKLEAFGAAGRQRVRTRFTIEVHTRETEEVYERVLAAASKPQ
jgi:glycosyltransferase involved in cell wall biosynthesis